MKKITFILISLFSLVACENGGSSGGGSGNSSNTPTPTPPTPSKPVYSTYNGQILAAEDNSYNIPYRRRLSDVDGGENNKFNYYGNIKWNGNFNYNSNNVQNNSEKYYTGYNVKVGIIDGGFNGDYYDDLYREVKNITRIYSSRISNDKDYHGYAVASLIAGKEGIAPDADMYVIDGTDDEDNDKLNITSDLYQKLYDRGVRIFNNSFGVEYETYSDKKDDFYKNDFSENTLDFYKTAVANGSLFVFSAGNKYYRTSGINPTLPYWLPELEKGWINANELMYKDNKTEFSEFRELKPFVGAASAKNWTITTIVDYFMTVDGISDVVSGTSFAAPRVTATAALIKQKCPFMVRDF